MRIRFTQSARKHRIGRARALHVIKHHEPIGTTSDNADYERLFWYGKDDRGLGLEVIAINFPDYLLVIHVMPALFRRRN